jgi:hypothetical protein
MGTEVNGAPLAFQEAIDYHTNKLALPSKAWTDIWGREHGRGFIVAGAATDDLVTGFHEAIGKALKDGRTLTDFRKDFDRLVTEHGWSYNGSRGWRSAVIYNTNLSQAYSAGRWEQGKSLPDAVGRYRHNSGAHERKEHAAWNGITLPLGHSWWGTHWPINAWGCHCQVDILSWRAARAAGWDVSDDPSPDEMVTKTVNTPQGPRTVTVPKGIDPGFDYNPGEAAFGHRLNDQVMENWRKEGRKYERLTAGDWVSAGRPERVPADNPVAKLGQAATSKADMVKMVRETIGGVERIYKLPDGSRVLVDAVSLGNHLAKDLARGSFLPFLQEVIEQPFEVWMCFERHPATGKVELRRRLVKVLELGDKNRPLVFTAQVKQGRLEDYTFHPVRNINRERQGKLVWGRPLTEAAGGGPGDG